MLSSEGQILFSGKTPISVDLNAGDGYFRSAQYVITFEKEGYQTAKRNIKSTIDGWYFGNILFGGFIGLLIDPATGAMWKIDQDVYIELLPEE